MKRILSNTKDRNDILGEELISNDKIHDISIASPFLSETDVLNVLLQQKSRLRLIVRLCTATSYSALKKLLNAENVVVKYFVDKHFHSKIYIVNNDYAIIGSSNFTNGGLRNNRELNIQISSEDEGFLLVNEIFEDYWDCGSTLTHERLEKFKTIIKAHKNEQEQLDKGIFEQLSEALGNDEKNGHEDINNNQRTQTEVDRKKQAEASSIANSKAVICVDTGKKYSSMKVAAKEIYNYERGYGYISDVCKGIRMHYKKHIWRFEDDYNAMSESERRSVLGAFEAKFSKKVKAIPTTKFLFRGQVFSKQTELAQALAFANIKIGHRAISALINQFKNRQCPFFKINSGNSVEHIYFADYTQIFSGSDLVEEEPVESTLEELEKYFESVFDIPIEDAKAIDILVSKRKIFYEIDGKFYKSKKTLKENNSYDSILGKHQVLDMLHTNNYEFLWNATKDDILSSTQIQYYLKNNYIFKNKPEYVSAFIKEITKDQLLIKLGLER